MNITALMSEDEHRLVKRIEELYSRAEKGEILTTQFLNLRERYIIEHRLAYMFSKDEADNICFFYGGYPHAERTVLCILPAFYRYSLTEGADTASLCREELNSAMVSLKIKTSGYVKLSHRDFLGALIGLGIERGAMGDILLFDDGAVIFVSPTVAQFIKNELTYIGRDKVRVTDASLSADFDFTPSLETIRGTVASARLDAVLSELANCSRETAKTVIKQGLVEHNHFTASEPDTEVAAGDIISARRSAGCKGGKFIVDSIDERTSKGRIRLTARRYT